MVPFRQRHKDSEACGIGKKLTDVVAEVYSPAAGKAIPLSKVSDRGFASGKIGDGIAIRLEDGEIVSPVQAEVLTVFGSGHAVALREEHGIDVLLHVGTDTASLSSKAFVAQKAKGDKVKIGDPLITVNLDYLVSEGYSTTLIVVLPNLDETLSIEKTKSMQVGKGDRLLLIGR